MTAGWRSIGLACGRSGSIASFRWRFDAAHRHVTCSTHRASDRGSVGTHPAGRVTQTRLLGACIRWSSTLSAEDPDSRRSCGSAVDDVRSCDHVRSCRTCFSSDARVDGSSWASLRRSQ
jgi:hypothetical protein